MNLRGTHSDNLDAIRTSDGIILPAVHHGSSKGVTLASSTTYVFMLDGNGPSLASIHLKWDAAVIVTFTIEGTNFPKFDRGFGTGPVDVSDHSAVAGEWMQDNPTTSYASGSGSGGLTVSNLTLTVAGGTAGGSTIHLGNFGLLRCRVKAVVAGTGGVVRCGVNGKA